MTKKNTGSQLTEWLFMMFVLAVFFVIYIIICPNNMAPDETLHFRRAFEVSKGGFIPKYLPESKEYGDFLPVEIYDFANPEATLDWNHVTEVNFSNTALYSPISYLPQALAIFVADLFTNNVPALFYSGRIGSAIVCFLLLSYALKTVPFGRRIVFTIMMFPLSVEEMTSMSPDGFVIALSIVFISYILKVSFSEKKISKTDEIFLFIISVLLSQCKIVYVVLLLLLFVIPKEKFASKGKAIIYKLGVLVFCGIINLVWLKISSGFLTVEFQPGVDSGAQLNLIMGNIPGYVLVCIRTIVMKGIWWATNMIGSYMGAMLVQTPDIIWILNWIILIVSIIYSGIYEGKKESVKMYQPVIMIMVFVTGMVLIFTSLYIQWTPLGKDTIDGIQGRYFTPLMSSLCPAVSMIIAKIINCRRKSLIDIIHCITTFSVVVFSNIMAIISITEYLKAGDYIWRSV